MAQDSKTGWKPSNALTRTIAIFSFAALTALAAGCEKKVSEVLVPNLRPVVRLSVSPLPQDSVFYAVLFRWFAFDEDGEIDHSIYSVDPEANGDTAWVRTDSLELTLLFESGRPPDPLPDHGSVTSSDYHVFVLKVVDSEGLASAPVFRAFTSYTIAPQTQIEVPRPVRLLAARTSPSLVIRWSGEDPDGFATDVPMEYRFRIALKTTIQEELNLGSQVPTASDIQNFFSIAAPGFESWGVTPPTSPFARFENLTPEQEQYFAVVAFDEAGAYEPRFILTNNVLHFWPSTNLIGPEIRIFNNFFSHTSTPGFVLDERNVGRLTFAADLALVLNWEASVKAEGSTIQDFRWVLDPVNGDIFDETPRENDSQTYRWSTWSLLETEVLVGPFDAQPGLDTFHRFYVEAQDDNGQLAIGIVEIRIVAPSFERPLLVIDDFLGQPDRLVNGDPDDPNSFQPLGPFPTEAVLDTLLYAVGGVPYQHRPQGTLSQPGVFAGFDFDTLDHRFIHQDGISIDILSRYQAVVWYLGIKDALRGTVGSRGFSERSSALRFITSPGELNTLVVYLSQGGKVWLFGGGILAAIGQGKAITEPQMGSFTYEFVKLRSQLKAGGTSFFGGDKLVGTTPYLPEFVTPGRPWPPDAWTGGRGATDDPRVGPSAERILPRWSGLPSLSFTTEFSDWPQPLPTSLSFIMYVSEPNLVLEATDMDPRISESKLDTLYLYRAKRYKLSDSPTNPDGKPMFLSYWGDDHGPIVWSALPLWFFERTQLRALADQVLGNFGLVRNPDRRAWTGPGSAHIYAPRELESP